MDSKIFLIDTTKLFDKKYTKSVKKNPAIETKFLKFIDLLAADPKYPSLKSHQISHSEYGKIWSSWFHDNLRVLWKYEGKQIMILLLDIGNHDDIY